MEMITIFTPSFADAENTNAQNLTTKEIVSRLPSDQYKVILLSQGSPDSRILARKNTELLQWSRHGNTARWLTSVLLSRIDIYFFPRESPLDALFLRLRRFLGLEVALVTYIVMALDEIAVAETMKRAIVEADHVVGNSLYVAKTVQDRFRVVTGTIYGGVRRDLFYPAVGRDRPSSKLTVLYAGSFQARKRVNLVIHEAAKWPLVDFRLIGKGEEEEKCRLLARDLGCRNVTFVGHLSQQALADEMRHADLFLFPSVLEGHPQVLVQAAACGLPAIAMDVYHPDYVVNGETGFLVESGEALTRKLSLLLRDSALRRSMSEAAIEHARKFDWDNVTEQWQRVFQSVVRERPRGSHVRNIRHL